MAKKPTKQQQIDSLQQQLVSRDREIVELHGQLKEARRRTIPIGDGKFALNFLPITVKSYDLNLDVIDVPNISSKAVCVRHATATIIVEGAVLSQ